MTDPRTAEEWALFAGTLIDSDNSLSIRPAVIEAIRRASEQSRRDTVAECRDFILMRSIHYHDKGDHKTGEAFQLCDEELREIHYKNDPRGDKK